ncbi:protein of unknown function [Actinoplanes derwentensis]|uniref:DUF1540 domain-containing protein n=2 Tax=Actinoplanes derwentensis TaxID=113562 RepID=A0A1H2D9D9_9ACTN|nr:DUF1540 domain-containing protein [Actinoplanes derwentensis]GID86392.1 hypothetical protein Ade03nite_53160 [Actinoplanes derwentensis]SDT79092.1 protein of unknown function [Actinoplanes derwentensis]
MTQMLNMPRVQACTATGCGYNHNGCTAFAITISESNSACGTFAGAGLSGGMGIATAQVGACKRADCKYNDNLECQAPAITVGASADLADCLTYEHA